MSTRLRPNASRPEMEAVATAAPPGRSAVAVSGPDNVGKTTQLRLLARRMGPDAALAGPLDSYDPRWISVRQAGTASWWFRDASAEELTDVLASSYLARARWVRGTALSLIDRGIPMLEASLAATMAVRENLDPPRAAGRAHNLLRPWKVGLRSAEDAEHAMLLLHDADPRAGAAYGLAREQSPTPRYASYQQHLNIQLLRMASEGRFDTVIVTGHRPVMAVQAEMRDRLAEVIPGVPRCRLPSVRVVALGGLSESGKSTAGEYLRTRNGFARLKIGYLIEEAACRCGIADPYREDAVIQAELLIDSLDRYCAAHHFVSRVSLESLHRVGPVAELSKLLGDVLTVIYLDASPSVRERRSAAGPADVRERDRIKCGRGAVAIRGMADRIIGNDGSRLELCRSLDRLVADLTCPTRPLRAVRVESLGLPASLTDYLTKLMGAVCGHPSSIDLLAVTGSGARGKYLHGWSDLDVLIIAGTAQLPRLRRVIAGLSAGLGGVKLGLTLITAEECAVGALTPRLLHVLQALGTGVIHPLWCRPRLGLPVPDAQAVAAESLRDGTQAAIEIRRQLLRGAPDLRALYKVAALLAKIMLRFEDAERPADDEALRTLLHDHLVVASGHDPIGRARHHHAEAEKVALAVLDMWLSAIQGTGDPA